MDAPFQLSGQSRIKTIYYVYYSKQYTVNCLLLPREFQAVYIKTTYIAVEHRVNSALQLSHSCTYGRVRVMTAHNGRKAFSYPSIHVMCDGSTQLRYLQPQ